MGNEGNPPRREIKINLRHFHSRNQLISCFYYMSKPTKNRLDPKDTENNPGIAKRQLNLKPGRNFITREMYSAIMDGYDGYSLHDMAMFYGPRVFATLCDLAVNGETEETKLKASALVSDRIYGKVAQAIMIEQNVNVSVGVVMIPYIPNPSITLEAVEVKDEND